jgi:hypothetical protein
MIQVRLVGAAAADEHAQAGDAGSWLTTLATSCIFCFVLVNEASCEVIMTPLMKPVSCCGKEAGGDGGVEQDRRRHRRQEHHQRHEFVAQTTSRARA